MVDPNNAVLYNAVMNKEHDNVLQYCKEIPEGPFCILTMHKDTVLHMALYSMHVELVTSLLDLLKEFPEDQLKQKMCLQNIAGNTILLEASIYDGFVPAAKEMLRKTPELLIIANNFLDKPLFRSVRYGQIKMFQFLDEEVNKSKIITSEAQRKSFYHNNGSNILHIAVITEQFEMALLIANKHPHLVIQRDKEGLTALQHFARNPTTFYKGRGWRKRYILSGVSNEGSTSISEKGASWCRLPWWKELRKKKQKYISALNLARLLTQQEQPWKYTNREEEKNGVHEFEEEPQTDSTPSLQKEANNVQQEKAKEPPTPLFLATRYGCVEIVNEILRANPEAFKHIDDEGNTILHIAIKYRQIEIFDTVEKMEIQMKWLARRVGKNSNSILHVVGEPREGRTAEDATQSPALQLRDDLLLFERIKEICSAYSFKHINSKGETAEGLFAETNEGLRQKAEEWLKETAKNCTIVAVLIVTVAFAAAYTVPGGSNPNSGVPLLINQPFFVIFTIADVFSLTFTLTSVIVFLSILTSPFRLRDFKQSLPHQLMLGFTLLIFSVSMMMLAFAATIILMIRNKEQWTKIALYTVAFFPVTVFAISYLPLYVSLLPTVKYSLKQIMSYLPEFDWVLIRSSITNKFKCSRNFPRKTPSNYTEIPVTSASCPPIPHTSPSVV